ncbi:hypothetical protein OROHE_002982 [Orobanche hederae]
METLHRYTSGGTEIHSKIASCMGHWHHIRNCLRSNEHLIYVTRTNHEYYVGNSSFKIPPASLSIFDTLSVIFWVPVYDRIIVPFSRKLVHWPQKRPNSAPKNGNRPLHIHIFNGRCSIFGARKT